MRFPAAHSIIGPGLAPQGTLSSFRRYRDTEIIARGFGVYSRRELCHCRRSLGRWSERRATGRTIRTVLAKKNMSSPYLSKPRRSLDEARADRARGHSHGPAISVTPARHRTPGLSRGGAWYGLGMGALLLGGVLVAMMAVSDTQIAEEPDPSIVIEISPAAGGSKTAAPE